MKANEAPEKIYLQQYDEDTLICLNEWNISEEWSNKPRNEKIATNIEYTRTDAFFSKAKKWFEENFMNVHKLEISTYEFENIQSMIDKFRITMKKLSTEEKARCYDEAIERARGEYAKFEGMLPGDVLEDIFPELKESEDERIGKSIIGFLITISSLRDGKTLSNEDFDSKAILEWVAWLEKQAEQKIVISDDALREGIAHFGITQYQIDNWLKKYVVVEKQGEQKAAWSEEDENMLNLTLSLLPYHRQCRNWLKSLKPQNRWKPSDEQMKALEHAINCYSCISPTNTEEVYTLEIMKEQLKKLREE